VVGHLIHAERANWMTRARVILEHGAEVPSGFDRYAMYDDSKGKSTEELLDTFAQLRTNNLYDLRALKLTPEQFDSPGTHPQIARSS